MWRFFLGLPIDLWWLLLRCVGWAIAPPGVNGSRFPWSHCLLRAAAAGPVFWWLLCKNTPDRGLVAALITAEFCFVTLVLSAMIAEHLGKRRRR